MQLAKTVKPTIHVNWFNRGGTGLAEYLGQFIFADEEEKILLELFETPNDADYVVEAVLTDFNKKKVKVDDRTYLLEQIKEEGGLEFWRLKDLLLAAVERGWLEEGTYAVHVSW